MDIVLLKAICCLFSSVICHHIIERFTGDWLQRYPGTLMHSCVQLVYSLYRITLINVGIRASCLCKVDI
ncbi:MAG: hypothetical protein ACD_2C00025G0002 [uncultured bacterium (gcode 4)]|uniref:Uncharacterized protein n=1 Tax=uncultured bacterium (gcode 4) TaxID=1234023 RepID=K2FGF2_9BACT|nr:MAG: hypothetical protein ACD_2C00025G0002 [uncultured bacterium (gcode 4)]